MLGSRKRWDLRAGDVGLALHIVALLLATASCFDMCPESLRQTYAERPPMISEDAVEKAFQEAYQQMDYMISREKKLVSQGKIVSKHDKSTDSIHPQANAPPRVHDLEHDQIPFEIASSSLQYRYKLSPEQMACGLQNLPLTQSAMEAQERCLAHQVVYCNSSTKYRTADGTCNNLDNPKWGSAFSCYRRILPPKYGYYGSLRWSGDSCYGLPDPRTLSMRVHSNVSRWTNDINHLYVFFGQLLDHDMMFTAQSLTINNEAIQCCTRDYSSHQQCAPIYIPYNDDFYPRNNVSCLNFVRSAMCPTCSLGSRVPMNTVTAFIDGSIVYGNSEEQTNRLRKFDGSGELIVENSKYGDLLPSSFNPQEDRCSAPEKNLTCFSAGDSRVNQHPMLTTLQTVFHREHNRLARMLRQLNPYWDEETIFQEVRKIIGAILQIITYKEFLPMTVGFEMMYNYDLWHWWDSTYDSEMDPMITTEFSMAMRYGHSLINSMMVEEPRKPGHAGHLLRDRYNQPFGLRTGEMEPLLRGSCKSSAQYLDRYMVPDVTNYLYRVPGRSIGSDLAAINIQRGRDHGIPGYSYYASYCLPNKDPITSFDDLVVHHLMTPESMEIMRGMYWEVTSIDLFTGLLSEIHIKNAIVGPTAACLIARQFWRLKFGDRHFVTHANEDGAFTYDQRNQLRYGVSLAKVICDNTNIKEIQRNPLLFPSKNNPVVPCKQIYGPSYSVWKDYTTTAAPTETETAV